MAWNVLILLHLFCAMAAIAGVHTQGDATEEVVVHDQAFEGEAVHSMMRSWLKAGTNPELFGRSRWSWYFEQHPCVQNWTRPDWHGISCSNMSYQAEDGNLFYYHSLVELKLVDYAFAPLVGGLPSAIVNLTNLETLWIENANKLSGPLPTGLFCSSKVLQFIVLSNCSFNGSISNGFGPRFDPWFGPDCGNTNDGLKHLDLSKNYFTEMSPISSNHDTLIYNYRFTNLQYLDLSRNSLTKFQDFFSFPLLQYLNVSYNQIEGEFGLFDNWEHDKLETIDISNNFITNITSLGGPTISNSFLIQSLKSIYAQNNSISRFPSEFFEFYTLQDIYLDLNNISSIAQNFSNIKNTTIQRIFMSKNKFQVFPKGLLQLPNLEEITLNSNHITGELRMPNILCQYSKIKLISLLHNEITHFYPSNDPTSCFSESRILLDNKIFLGGNPICTNQSLKARVLRLICRFNASSPIEVEEFTNVKKSYKILLIILTCVSGIVVVLFTTGFFLIQKLKKKISLLHEIQNEFDKRDVKPNLYSFSELKVATQDFHIRNELGRGGFGIVYKGVLPDGSHVAVKKLTKLSMEQGLQDFLSEIIVVSNIKHRNLVQLKGCCIKENQRILVHEFIENKNLEDNLWGDSRSSEHLDWSTRFNIILGIARGLAYLHEEVQPAIVHRDIKGENILLDKHCNPKIADFGLALFFPSFDDGETHMSVSKVAGTRGYMAPEYLCYGQVSTKLDVFSFGVLLLEIVSGRKKIDLKLPLTEQYLVQWAQELHSNDNLPNLKDKSLEEMTMVEEAMFKRVVKVGLQCLHHIGARRPAMSEVVTMLIGNKNVDECALEDYQEGSSSSYGMKSSSFHFSIPSSSLQCIAEDDNNSHLDCESHKQSLELCEVGLLSK